MPVKDKDKHRLTGRKVCPFHKYSTASGIVCKGYFEKSSLAFNFGDRGDKQEYQRRYCCNEWQKCKRAAYLTALLEDNSIF